MGNRSILFLGAVKQLQHRASYFLLIWADTEKDEFDEFHYKMVVAATDKAAAIHQAKQTAFFKHTHFEGASSHIDDKYGIDVDDLYTIDEVLPKLTKEQYSIELTPIQEAHQDELHLGYFKFDSL